MRLAKQDSIFVNILYYAASSLFQKFLAVFTAFVRPKLLSPELFGLWSVLSVLPNYASYLHLGSRSSLRFLVPYYEARNDQEAIASSKAAVLRGTFAPTLLVALCLLILAVFSNAGWETRIGLIAVGLIILLNWRFDYLIGVLKSHQRFRLISRYYYVASIVSFSLTVGLIYFFGFYGALLAVILTVSFGIIYLQRLYTSPTPARFQFGVFGSLVKTGFPIVLFNLVSELLRTSDRFVLFFMLGEETVGYYGIAVMALGLAISIPAISREVVEPKLMENLDKATLAHNIERFVTRPLMNTAYLMPFVIGPSVLLLPVVIPLLLPEYVPGIAPAQILLIGGFFLATAHSLRGIIVAYKLQLKASILAFIILIINITLSLIAVHLGYGTEGVALASSLSFFLMFGSLLTFVWWQMRNEEHGLSPRLAWFFVPFPLMCALLFISDRLFGNQPGIAIHMIFAQLALFLIVQGALLLVMRQSGVVAFRVDTR